MQPYTDYFAGEERAFRLSFGDVLDLEEACGRTGIGAIFHHLATHSYSIREVHAVIRIGLIGGGMPHDEAARLCDDRMTELLVVHHELAMNILLALMSGIDTDETQPAGDPERPYDAGAIFAALLKLGVAPEQVRGMSYADFAATMRAMGGAKAQPPSESEFKDMLRQAKESGLL